MRRLGIIAVVVLIYGANQIKAQTCGFGCLGLSGFYGGYSIQSYKAEELNNYITEKILLSSSIAFEQSKGIRVGVNLFRAKFQNYFITAKGYFQFLKENKTTNNLASEGQTKHEFELKQDYWGIAFDFGIPVTDFFDFKLVEAGVNFYNMDLTHAVFLSNEKINETKYETPEMEIGYYLGSGLIIHLIKDYVSLEGTAFYSFVEFQSLESKRNEKIELYSNSNLLESSGISGTLQLNLGFPL
ncbi:MAG: hypothetical protein PVH88_16205 [Ignavibacteria bacterium]|jgi:hypothetical protein